MTRNVALALLICVLVTAAGGSAPDTAVAAPGLRATSYTKHVSAGGQVRIDLALDTLRRCVIRTPGTRGTVDVRGAASARIKFRAHQRARTGRYPVRVGCDPRAQVTVTVRVKGSRRGARRLLAGAALVRLTLADGAETPRFVPVAPPAASPTPATPGATVVTQSRADTPRPPARPVAGDAAQAAEAAAFAAARWELHGAAFEAQFRHGECTDLAQRRRPDVVRRASLAIWHDEYLGGTYDPQGWVAHSWDDNARYAGLAVGSEPRAGAIAVFEPGVAGTGRTTGHVAVVEEVLPDGRFRTTDMNVGGPYLTAGFTRTPEPGINFVY